MRKQTWQTLSYIKFSSADWDLKKSWGQLRRLLNYSRLTALLLHCYFRNSLVYHEICSITQSLTIHKRLFSGDFNSQENESKQAVAAAKSSLIWEGDVSIWWKVYVTREDVILI